MNIDKSKIDFNKCMSDMKDNKYMASYLAVAKIYLENSTDRSKVGIKNFTYKVNELAVIDRKLLEKIILNLNEYAESFFKPKTKKIKVTTLLDVICISMYVDGVVLDAAEKHVDVYEKSYNVSLPIIKELIKD